MAKTIIATFAERIARDHAISDLLDYGFRSDEISIIAKEQDLYLEEEQTHEPVLTSRVESIATGLVFGAGIGAIIGYLVGIGVLTVAGVFSLLVNLPIIKALGLVGAAATTAAGGIYGALIGALGGFIFSFLNPLVESSYEERDSLVIAIPVIERQEYEVKNIITEAGASNIKILDLKPYEEEEQYREYHGGYGVLAGMKGGEAKTRKTQFRNDPATAGQDKYEDEF